MLKGNMSYKKIGAIIVGVTIFAGGFVTYAKQSNQNQIVSLGSQKADVENSLSIESVNTLEDFKASEWFGRDKVLGIKGLSNDYEDNTICIYDQSTDTFENIDTTRAGETVIIDRIYDENMFFYGSLIDNDFARNRYRLYLYDLDKKQVVEVSSKETDAFYDESRQKILIAEGFKMFISDILGNRKEIVLPNDLINDLNDFSSFTFKDYKELYYRKEELSGDRLETIKSHYEYRVKYNAIRSTGFITDQEIFISADNNKEFVYNINTAKYRIANEEEHRIIYSTTSKSQEFFECVRGDRSVGEANAILWSLDDKGNRKDIIDSGMIYILEASPDKQKLIYLKVLKNNEKRILVYDTKEQKGIEIFTPVTGSVGWNKESKQFFITGSYKDKEGIWTSIVRMRK